MNECHFSSVIFVSFFLFSLCFLFLFLTPCSPFHFLFYLLWISNHFNCTLSLVAHCCCCRQFSYVDWMLNALFSSGKQFAFCLHSDSAYIEMKRIFSQKTNSQYVCRSYSRQLKERERKKIKTIIVSLLSFAISFASKF